jgi:hypothetical protein
VLVATSLAAFQSASAARTANARFLVTVRASITKQWSYTSARTSEACRVAVRGSGTRKISLRSRDVSVVTARWTGGRSRVRFSGALRPLGVTVRQSGTKTTKTSGADCEESVERATCAPLTRAFQGPGAQLVSGRVHRLSFRRMKNLVPDEFFNDCPGEPGSVRAVVAGLAFADAKFSERELFNRAIGGLTIEGEAEGSTTLLNGSAKIEHRVRWTLTLRRLGG